MDEGVSGAYMMVSYILSIMFAVVNVHFVL